MFRYRDERRIYHGLLVLLATLPATATAQSVPVDGIAAIVNAEVISIGEVLRAAALVRDSALWNAAGACGPWAGREPRAKTLRPPEQEEPAAPGRQLSQALECLIDRTLVFREVRRFPQLDVSESEVRDAYEQVAGSFESPDAFGRELQRYGLTPDGVRSDLRLQLLIANYIDDRFRATVDISRQQARDYWEQTLAPDMRRRGIEVPSFESVTENFIIPILREREVNRRVQSWVSDLRQRATIRRNLSRARQ